MRCTHATYAASTAAIILGHYNIAGNFVVAWNYQKCCSAWWVNHSLSELEKTREFWPYDLIISTFFYLFPALLQNARCVTSYG